MHFNIFKKKSLTAFSIFNVKDKYLDELAFNFYHTLLVYLLQTKIT